MIKERFKSLSFVIFGTFIAYACSVRRTTMDKLLKILPDKVSEVLKKLRNDEILKLTEIRLRVSYPVYFYMGREEFGINEFGLSKRDGVIFSQNDANVMWRKLCDGSPYSTIKNQKQGYITVNGNRIGFVGRYRVIDGQIKHIDEISSFCVRIKHEKKGCANKVYKYFYENNELLNTLIISPPGCGKTTLLRDTVRLITFDGNNAVLVDERDEIAALEDGIPTLDVGKRCDVFSGVDKKTAIENSLRSMKPDVFVLDEIGWDELEIMKKASEKGVKIIATLHGKDFGDVKDFKNIFDRFIFLSDNFGVGTIAGVYNSSFKEELCC